MSRSVIHLLSIGGSDRELAAQLGLASSAELLDYVQEIIGTDYRVTGNLKLIDAGVDDQNGGRTDDAERARDLQKALRDDKVTALVALRGGAWVTRILPQIKFDVLRKRKNLLHVFGFSELSTLINITASYPKVRACYDASPGFLLWGLKQYAMKHYESLTEGMAGLGDGVSEARSAFAAGWAKGNFNLEFVSQVLDVVKIVEDQSSDRRLEGQLVQGRVADGQQIEALGGCLSVFVTLLGSPHQRRITPKGKWLALEDIREHPYRLDRYLAQLKWSGVFEHCAGLLLGDFHVGDQDQTDTVLRLLEHHLPARRRLPIVARCNFGHCYPAAPLPIRRAMTLRVRRQRITLKAGAP